MTTCDKGAIVLSVATLAVATFAAAWFATHSYSFNTLAFGVTGGVGGIAFATLLVSLNSAYHRTKQLTDFSNTAPIVDTPASSVRRESISSDEEEFYDFPDATAIDNSSGGPASPSSSEAAAGALRRTLSTTSIYYDCITPSFELFQVPAQQATNSESLLPQLSATFVEQTMNPLVAKAGPLLTKFGTIYNNNRQNGDEEIDFSNAQPLIQAVATSFGEQSRNIDFVIGMAMESAISLTVDRQTLTEFKGGKKSWAFVHNHVNEWIDSMCDVEANNVKAAFAAWREAAGCELNTHYQFKNQKEALCRAWSQLRLDQQKALGAFFYAAIAENTPRTVLNLWSLIKDEVLNPGCHLGNSAKAGLSLIKKAWLSVINGMLGTCDTLISLIISFMLKGTPLADNNDYKRLLTDLFRIFGKPLLYALNKNTRLNPIFLSVLENSPTSDDFDTFYQELIALLDETIGT